MLSNSKAICVSMELNQFPQNLAALTESRNSSGQFLFGLFGRTHATRSVPWRPSLFVARPRRIARLVGSTMFATRYSMSATRSPFFTAQRARVIRRSRGMLARVSGCNASGNIRYAAGQDRPLGPYCIFDQHALRISSDVRTELNSATASVGRPSTPVTSSCADITQEPFQLGFELRMPPDSVTKFAVGKCMQHASIKPRLVESISDSRF